MTSTCQQSGSLWTHLPESLACVLPLDAREWEAVAELPPAEQLYWLGIEDVILEVVSRQGEVLGIGPLILSLALLSQLNHDEAYFRWHGGMQA
jgi:hypothetical protein